MFNSFILDKITIFTPLTPGVKEKICENLLKINREIVGGGLITFKISVRYNKLWLEFCPAKVWDYSHNLCGIGLSRLRAAVWVLQRVLDENFKECKLPEIAEWKFSQIHLTNNIETEHIFPCYISLFEKIRPRRDLVYTCIDNSCIYYQNKKHDGTVSSGYIIRIYDKGKELKQRQREDTTCIEVFPEPGKDSIAGQRKANFSHKAEKVLSQKSVFAGAGFAAKSRKYRIDVSNRNIMRFEIALNKGLHIKNKLGVVYLKDILSFDKFKELNDRRIEILRETLFYQDVTVTQNLDSMDDMAFLKYLRSQKQTNAVLLLALMQSAENIDYRYLKEVLVQGGYSLQHVKKQLDNIRKLHKVYKGRKECEADFSSLYSEIYNKLFNVPINIDKMR